MRSQVLPILLRKYCFPTGNLTTFALYASILGVMIGIAQMMLVLSVMSGFEGMLKKNYTRFTSDMVVQGAGQNVISVLARIKKHPGIDGVTPFYLSQGLVIGNSRVAGIVLEGIDRKTVGSVVDFKSVWRRTPIVTEGDWIWLGSACAKKLGLNEGDNAEIVIADQKNRKNIPVTVSAITKFGIYDHDLHYAIIDQKFFLKIFGNREPFFKVAVSKETMLSKVKNSLQKALGGETRIRLWNELHRNIFMAVNHQKKLLFLVLQIVVGLAGVNVINLLVMNSHFRRRDLAILRAMGLGRGEVFILFLAQGLVVGLTGVVLGVLMGFGVCYGVEAFQPSLLNEAVYNVTRLPIELRTLDIVMIVGVALLICLVFSVFPAWRAMRMLPIESLRNE